MQKERSQKATTLLQPPIPSEIDKTDKRFDLHPDSRGQSLIDFECCIVKFFTKLRKSIDYVLKICFHFYFCNLSFRVLLYFYALIFLLRSY